MAAASPRLVTPSLPRMLDTCTLAVFTEMNSSPAISRLLCPAAMSRSTSYSRAVSPSAGPGAGSAPVLPAAAPVPGSSAGLREILARRATRATSPPSGPAPSSRASAPAPAVAVACAQRRLGRPEQGRGQRVGLGGRLPALRGIVPGGAGTAGGLAGARDFGGERQLVSLLRQSFRGQLPRGGAQTVAQCRGPGHERLSPAAAAHARAPAPSSGHA